MDDAARLSDEDDGQVGGDQISGFDDSEL